jgi:hypothetical protein
MNFVSNTASRRPATSWLASPPLRTAPGGSGCAGRDRFGAGSVRVPDGDSASCGELPAARRTQSRPLDFASVRSRSMSGGMLAIAAVRRRQRARALHHLGVRFARRRDHRSDRSVLKPARRACPLTNNPQTATSYGQSEARRRLSLRLHESGRPGSNRRRPAWESVADSKQDKGPC